MKSPPGQLPPGILPTRQLPLNDLPWATAPGHFPYEIPVYINNRNTKE